jgi:catechol 2,3-dioxygenase-like lactoylglutathione lyase family enzyme
MPAFVTVERDSMRLFLSEHEGDARPHTLIYLNVTDVRPIAREFGASVEAAPWGLEIEIVDPDRNRLCIGSHSRGAAQQETPTHSKTCHGVSLVFSRATPFLATRDINATIAFYTQLLGFRVSTRHPQDQPTMVVLDHGDASMIFDSTLWPGVPAMTGQVHFDLGSRRDGPSNVLALHERVKPHATVLWGPEVYSYGRREFSCSDPNGYALVFSEQTDEEPTCAD